MNDIQIEVNFFEWFDKYYKRKILANRNTNFLLQKEATQRPLTTNTFITKAMTTNHAHEISNTKCAWFVVNNKKILLWCCISHNPLSFENCAH